MYKLRKSQADYSRGHREAHCGHAFDGDKGFCRYFIGPKSGSAPGECLKVEGEIGRLMWCRLFSRAQSQ